MSVIYLTHHDENIYNVIKPPEEIYIKPPRYISSFNKKVRREVVQQRLTQEKYSTMGPPQIPPEDPKKFLRKRSGKTGKSLPESKPPDLENVQGKLPKPDDLVKKRIKRDYIRKNILHIKRLTFKEPEAKYIDTRFGDSFRLETSGLKPIYMIQKNKYGKPPEYLLKRMQTKGLYQQQHQDITEIQALPKCRYVTRQERLNLLTGLKKNWEEMQKEFQLLPMITDTIPKINRKVKLEKDLQALEKDIILIEKHPYIYIDESQENEN